MDTLDQFKNRRRVGLEGQLRGIGIHLGLASKEKLRDTGPTGLAKAQSQVGMGSAKREKPRGMGPAGLAKAQRQAHLGMRSARREKLKDMGSVQEPKARGFGRTTQGYWNPFGIG
ncbi:unnamed protein product [Prunus armeniaca]